MIFCKDESDFLTTRYSTTSKKFTYNMTANSILSSRRLSTQEDQTLENMHKSGNNIKCLKREKEDRYTQCYILISIIHNYKHSLIRWNCIDIANKKSTW